MVDNVTLNSGSGGATLAADDIAGVHHQRVKIQHGADGSATDVSAASPLPVDGSGVTQPVSAASLPLPTGASTAANQATANTALSAIQTAVELLDNAISGTEMQVDVVAPLPAGTNAIGKLAANSGVDIGDVDVTSLPSDTFVAEAGALGKGVLLQGDDGTDRKNINVDATTGDVQVDVTNTVTVDGSGVTQPISAASLPLPTGAATAANQSTANAALSAIQTAVELIDNAISGTEMQVDVVAPLPAGTNAIGKLAANSGVDIGDVDVTSISAGSNLIGDVGISGARTSGGTTLYKNIDVDESEDQVKGTAGQVYWIHAMNLSASVVYLKLYNATAATVVVGTTVPDLTFPIPTQGDTNGAGFVLSIPNGIAFSTAITIACTTGVGDADSGAPAANVCVVNMGYA